MLPVDWGDSSVTNVHHQCGGMQLQLRCWGGRAGWLPDACWSANLVYLVSSRSERDLILQNLWTTPEEQHPRLSSGFHMHTYMCVYTYIYLHTNRRHGGTYL